MVTTEISPRQCDIMPLFKSECYYHLPDSIIRLTPVSAVKFFRVNALILAYHFFDMFYTPFHQFFSLYSTICLSSPDTLLTVFQVLCMAMPRLLRSHILADSLKHPKRCNASSAVSERPELRCSAIS